MNKEVLEVLAYMEEYTKDKDMQYSEPMLNAKDLRLVLDYIEQLKEDRKVLFEENHNKEQVIIKQSKIIDKAIEYIENELSENGSGNVSGSDLPHYVIEELEDILKGDSNE